MLLKFDCFLEMHRFGLRRVLGFAKQCQDRHRQFQAAMAAAFGRVNFMRRTFIRERYLNPDAVPATRELNLKFGQEKIQLVERAVAGEFAEKHDQGSSWQEEILIESYKWYRMAHTVSPDYFKKKYGTENPLIYIHGTDKALLGCSYLDDSRPVSMAFFQRIAGKTERLPEEGIYGGKVEDTEGHYLSELVMAQELEAYEGPDSRSQKRK